MIFEKIVNNHLKAYTIKGNKSYLNKALFRPEEKHYKEIGEEPYIKYSCPI